MSMLRCNSYMFMSSMGLVCHGFGGASDNIEVKCVRDYRGDYLHVSACSGIQCLLQCVMSMFMVGCNWIREIDGTSVSSDWYCIGGAFVFTCWCGVCACHALCYDGGHDAGMCECDFFNVLVARYGYSRDLLDVIMDSSDGVLYLALVLHGCVEANQGERCRCDVSDVPLGRYRVGSDHMRTCFRVIISVCKGYYGHALVRYVIRHVYDFEVVLVRLVWHGAPVKANSAFEGFSHRKLSIKCGCACLALFTGGIEVARGDMVFRNRCNGLVSRGFVECIFKLWEVCVGHFSGVCFRSETHDVCGFSCCMDRSTRYACSEGRFAGLLVCGGTECYGVLLHGRYCAKALGFVRHVWSRAQLLHSCAGVRPSYGLLHRAQDWPCVSRMSIMDYYKVLQYPGEERLTIVAKVDSIIDNEIRRHVGGESIEGIIAKHHERICERTVSMKAARDTLEETVDLSSPSFDALWSQLWHVSFKGKQNRDKEVHAWAERDSLRKTKDRAIVRASLTVTMTYMTETREMLTPMWEEIKEVSTKKKAYHAWRALLFISGICPMHDEQFPAPGSARGSKDASGCAKGVDTTKGSKVLEKAMPAKKERQATPKAEEQMTCPSISSDDSDDDNDDEHAQVDEQAEQHEGRHDALKRKFGIFVKKAEKEQRKKARRATYRAWSRLGMDEALAYEQATLDSLENEQCPWRATPTEIPQFSEDDGDGQARTPPIPPPPSRQRWVPQQPASSSGHHDREISAQVRHGSDVKVPPPPPQPSGARGRDVNDHIRGGSAVMQHPPLPQPAGAS
eukprot:5136801-Amphidinium_carterae.3